MCKILNLYVCILCVFLSAGLAVFWSHPQNQFVNNNERVMFECFANASNATIDISWEKDRRSYTSGVTQVTTHSNGVSSSLTLNRATVADSGKYRCRATNVDRDSAVSNEGDLISLSFCSYVNIKIIVLTYSFPANPHQP